MIYKFENLTIPHPEIANRAFVLVPLKEIAPELIHPVEEKSVANLISQIDISNINEYRMQNGS